MKSLISSIQATAYTPTIKGLLLRALGAFFVGLVFWGTLYAAVLIGWKLR